MMWTRRIVSLATLPVVLVLAACKGESQQQQQEAAQPAEQQEVAQPAYEIEIVNPMPHAMIITAEYGAGETVELGIVDPMGTTTFAITAPAGTVVKLSAADEAATHTVQSEVTLSGEATQSWTVGK